MSPMSWPKLSSILTCATLVVAVALAADWLAAQWFGVGSPSARWTLLGASLTALLLWLALFARRHRALADWVRSTVAAHEHERAAFENRARRDEAQIQRIHSILSALAEPVMVLDKRDQLVLANASANSLFGLEKNDGHERALDALVECEQLVDLLTDTRKCRAFTQRSCEIEMRGADGASRWFRVTARNIPTQPGQSDPDGTSQGVVAVLHDISSQKMIQKRNAEFVSAVSHEMKTPLAGIKAYLELLADGEAEDKQTEQQFLQVIGDKADRLQSLVDDLVDLARIEADLAGASRLIHRLKVPLAEALAAVRPLAEAKQIRLRADFCGSEPRVLVDRHLITQAARHLLSNAVKYTPPGGHVTLRSRRVGREVCFEVEDTGVGISTDDCRKVFDKFYRVVRDRDASDGTGLGLPLVKHIVETVHAGRIEVDSTPGKGSSFRVFLPNAGVDEFPVLSPMPVPRAAEECIS